MVRLRILVVTAILFVFASPAFAKEVLTIYYDGCGASSYYVGEHLLSCAGGSSQSGQQTGHWKEVSWYDCSTGDTVYFYYERCGNSWVPVSASAFLGSCNC